MAGFEGFISLFDDDWFEGTLQSSPQALFVDQESLTFDKAIEYRAYSVGDSRVGQSSHLVGKEKKPKGGITYQFRSGDILKVLLSHFQSGTQSGGTRYQFYPRTNTLDYSYRGTLPNQAYGRTVAQPYTVSLLKKVFSTSSNGGTNSFFFKHGICDKLGFSMKAGQDAVANANFVFRDLDYGTAVSGLEDGTVGTYESTPAFQYWSATALLNGAAFDLTSFEINSDQNVQEYSRVGRQDPEHYQFSGYTCKGNLNFDLPGDAMLHVGSMFGTRSFSFTATLFNSATDRVIFEMPNCVRLPFDYQFPNGNSPVIANMPFQAFESNGTFPIRVTVDTLVGMDTELIIDALLGARSISDDYDAALGARTLSAFTILNRT